VAERGEPLNVGEQRVYPALLAGQRQFLGIAKDLRRDVARQIFAKRGLGVAALLGPDRADRRAGCGEGQGPAAEPAERR